MTPDKIRLMRGASYLLPDPGGEVVRELLDEIERLQVELARITKRAHVDCHGHSEYRSVTAAEVDAAIGERIKNNTSRNARREQEIQNERQPKRSVSRVELSGSL